MSKEKTASALITFAFISVVCLQWTKTTMDDRYCAAIADKLCTLYPEADRDELIQDLKTWHTREKIKGHKRYEKMLSIEDNRLCLDGERVQASSSDNSKVQRPKHS